VTERALKYRQTIDRYARQYDHERLSESQWQAIEMVAGWLEAYRAATSYMSSTKQTTLSSVYSIFTALQGDLRERMHALNYDMPPELAQSLRSALLKLSEYVGKTDASPYYLWSSCKQKPSRARTLC
jgi:hypothetical protein